MGDINRSSQMNDDLINDEIEQRNLLKLYEKFCVTATLQGRIAYLLMSVHAVNPNIVKCFTDYNPKKCLFVNMVYGIAIMIYCRPSVMTISKFHRASFSILGSLMFNHSSMLFYEWLMDNFSHRPYLLTFLGFLGGRIMMLHLLAFFYNVDSRYRGFHVKPIPDYEAMYSPGQK